MTKKSLVQFDPENPTRPSSDFLVPTREGGSSVLLGSASHRVSRLGLVVYVGRELTAQDLFARLVETGRAIDSVDAALADCASFLDQVSSLRIGQVVQTEDRAESGEFRLVTVPKSDLGDSKERRLP